MHKCTYKEKKMYRLSVNGKNMIGEQQIGDPVVPMVAKSVSIKEGHNLGAGIIDLVAGTRTINNTTVTATSRIRLSIQALGTVTVPCALGVSARSPGVSFTILSSDSSDTSTVYWEISEPG